MNIGKIKIALQFSWAEVSMAISDEIAKVLSRKLNCNATWDDSEYWGVKFVDSQISVSELNMLFASVDASLEVQKENLYEECEIPISSIGMQLGDLLLQRTFGCTWENSLIEEHTLTLIGVKHKNDSTKKRIISFNNFDVDMDDLKTKEQLLSYLQENEPTHTSLMDFCAEYRERYHNELCWPYPISDGKHLGTFLILIREGVLSLPYDAADEADYETFQLQDAVMFDAKSMQIFIDDWNSFDQDLTQAMYSMKNYLQKQEERNEKTN